MNNIFRPIDSDKPKPKAKSEIIYQTSWADRLLVSIAHIFGGILLLGVTMVLYVAFGTLTHVAIIGVIATIIFALVISVTLFMFLRGFAFLGETMIFRLDQQRLRIQTFLFDKQVGFKAIPLKDVQSVEEVDSGDPSGLDYIFSAFFYLIFHRRTYIEIEIQKRISRNPVSSKEVHRAYFQPEVNAPMGSRLKLYTKDGLFCIPKSTTNYKVYRSLADWLLSIEDSSKKKSATLPRTKRELKQTKFRVIMPDEYEDD